MVGSKTTEEVKDLMHSYQLFLLSSTNEVLPTVLLEAQAAEMLVIATDVGSVKTIVKSGVVVPPNDGLAFREAIESLILRRFEWQEVAVTGRDHIIAYYDIDRQVKRLIDLYKMK